MSPTRRSFLQGAAAAAAAGWAARFPAGALAQAEAGGAGGAWLAGDLHVHTTYSHDVWAGPGDDNTGPEDFFTLGWSVADRFAQARDRGLDYLAISDHNDVRSLADPGLGGAGVIALPAYEASLQGHAQLIGARREHPRGDSSPAAARSIARAVRAEGGLFQANHPVYAAADESLFVDSPAEPPKGCCDSCLATDWKYGFELEPDLVEIWNAASPPNALAEAWWECWLDRGRRVAATGGSDSHWRSTNAVQGPGQPTTWVHALERSAAGVIAGLRAGRTSISHAHPAGGGPLLLLEADRTGDGSFAAGIGDEAAPGTWLRVRAEGLAFPGTVRLRANGRPLGSARLEPGGEVRMRAPQEPGWVRAALLQEGGDAPMAVPCLLIEGESILQPHCRRRSLLAAMTSALWLSAPGRELPKVRLAAPRSVRGGRLDRLELALTASNPAAVAVRIDAPGRRRGKRTLLARAGGELLQPGTLELKPAVTRAGRRYRGRARIVARLREDRTGTLRVVRRNLQITR